MSRRMLSIVIAALGVAAPARAEEPKVAAASSDALLGTEAGQVRDDNGLKMKLVWCVPGAFMMGGNRSPDQPEEPDPPGRPMFVGDPPVKPMIPTRVFLTRGYWLGRHEVTQSEWKTVVGTSPWQVVEQLKTGDDFPATCMSCDDALRFCLKLTAQEREAGRLPETWEYTLPTEAQWERGCRAGTETRFSFGDDRVLLDDYGWSALNTSLARERYPHRVGQKLPNPWGLYDMHGNVWEWCRDYHAEKWPGGRDPETTAPNPAGALRTMRGGSFITGDLECTSAGRRGYAGAKRNVDIGFRVALTPVRPATENPAK